MRREEEAAEVPGTAKAPLRKWGGRRQAPGGSRYPRGGAEGAEGSAANAAWAAAKSMPAAARGPECQLTVAAPLATNPSRGCTEMVEGPPAAVMARPTAFVVRFRAMFASESSPEVKRGMRSQEGETTSNCFPGA